MRVSLLPLITRPRRDVPILRSDGSSVPILIGDGEVDFTCWRCGFTICEGMRTVVEISGRVFRCPGCSAFNRSRQ